MFMRSKLSTLNYHSATMSKKMMKMVTISTKISSRLEVLDDNFLRTCLLLVVDLDLEVGLVPENLRNFCTSDSTIRLLCDNQVE